MTNIQLACSKLMALGFDCVPTDPGSKETYVKWGDNSFNEGDFGLDQNISIHLGESFVDVDLDWDEAVRLAPMLLPASGCSWGRKSKPLSHVIYRRASAQSFESKTLKCDQEKPIIELRTGKKLVLAPGSTHGDGETLEWVKAEEPSEVDPAELSKAITLVALGALILRHCWGAGSHHAPVLGIAGVLSKSGYEEQDAASLVKALHKVSPVQELPTELAAVKDTFARAKADKSVAGLSILMEHGLPDAAAKAIGKWLPSKEVAAAFTKPDETLIKEQQPAPDFPLESLGAAAEWVGLAAKGANAPVDFTAGALLGAVSAVLANVRRVEIRNGWIEAPIIWPLLVGPPSSGKTPAARPILKSLMAIEAGWEKEHWAKIQTQIDELQAQLSVADASAKKDIEADIDDLRQQLDCPPRCVAMDTTIEALAHIQCRSPRGLLSYSDELSGLISNLSRYSNGSDRTYYVQSWNGCAYR